jgi:c-di-GMP-binding flagellar brake protein YcgR
MEIKKELTLNPGDTLQLQFYPQTGSNKNERYYVRVIGYLAGKSIITTAPVLEGKLISLHVGEDFAVRLISGNSIQAFICNLLKKTTVPYPYIHLSYPARLESKIIRQAERINTHIIASIQNQQPGKEHIKTKSAVINDISSAGALVIASEELGDVNDMVTISSKLSVAGVEKYLDISAIIRRCLGKNETDDDKYRYGVEFQLADEMQKLTLHGYVYEQMAKAMK